MGKKYRKHGEGGLRQRKDGRWEGRIVVAREADGKCRTKSVYAKTREECEEKMHKLKVAEGVYTEHLSPDMPFGDWLEYWYKYHCKMTLRPSTQTNYERSMRLHIIPRIGHIPLNKLTPVDIQKFYQEEKESGRCILAEHFGEGLSDTSIRHFHCLCSAALKKAVEERLIDFNPAKECKIPPKKKREMKILSHEEIERLMIQAKADGFFEFLLLELATGLRRGELAALQWSDLNLKTGELTINKQLQRYGGGIGLALTTPKTSTSRRTIILPSSVLEVYKTFKKTATSEWLFPSPYDPSMPLDPAVYGQRVKSVLERAECKHVRFHDLRHTFATLALEEGMDVKTLSAILGHVSSDVSLDVYAHTTTTMQQEAAKTIERRISQNRSLMFTPSNVPQKAEKIPFTPKKPKHRKHGTGCVSELNDHLFEGRYSPFVNGKRISYNVYAKTREECEELLAELISTVKPELDKRRKYCAKPSKQRKLKVLV